MSYASVGLNTGGIVKHILGVVLALLSAIAGGCKSLTGSASVDVDGVKLDVSRDATGHVSVGVEAAPADQK